MKDLGLLSDKYTVLVTGTVQEEDCDGLCWQYIINEDKVRPEFVVSTEPTDGGIMIYNTLTPFLWMTSKIQNGNCIFLIIK